MIRTLTTLVAASLIAAPAIPAMAGGSEGRQATAGSLTASAFEELGAPPSLVDALHEGDDPERVYPYLKPVGDLDGDGADDVLSFTTRPNSISDDGSEESSLVVTARRGNDGAELFSTPLEVDGIVTLLEYGPVGQNGDRGLLLGIYNYGAMVYGVNGPGVSKDPYGERPFSYSTVGVDVSLTLMALGGDGSVVWQRSFADGKFAYTGLTLAVVQDLPVLSGASQAVPGGPQDLTVAVYDRTPTANNSQDDALQLQTIDGQTGTIVATRNFDIDNTEAPVSVAPDLDGDGLDDVLVRLLPAAGTTPVSSKTLVGLRGIDGTELWRNGTLPLSRDIAPASAGDVNGDGIGDLLLTNGGVRESSEAPTQHVVLVNGKSGAPLLSSDADTARTLGDIDGDGSSELLLSSAFFTATSVEIIHEAVDGTGSFVWDSSFSAQGALDPHAYLLPSPGDVDGDGIADIAHHIAVRKDSSTTDLIEDIRVVSGRTGQTIRSGGPAGSSLGGSLDGNGDDSAVVAPFGDTAIDVTGVDGLTGASRFISRLRPRADERNGVRVEGADVNGDGFTDLIVNVNGRIYDDIENPAGSSPDPIRVADGYVVNGRNGALLWSTDPPRLPVEPDTKAAVASEAPYSWNGTPANGLNGQVASFQQEQCGSDDDPTTKCDTLLLEFANPPVAGATSATREATITLDQFGPVVEPASDFDLYVYESDELGTLGPEVDSSGSAGEIEPIGEEVTLQVTTTKQQPSHFYLVQVVYYRSVQSGYHGSASFA